MTEETAPPEGEGTTPPEEKQHQESIPYEKWQATNRKAKQAADEAKTLKAEMAELRASLEERESAGLPELEQLKKRLDAAEKAREQAESKASDLETQATQGKRKDWVKDAAAEAKFVYPSAVANLDEIDLDAIESEEDAARAVKRVAKKYPKLIETEEPALPGRVLENGRSTATQEKHGGINLDAEAQMVADNLAKFLANRQKTS